MSCDLIIPSKYFMEDLPVTDVMSDSFLGDADESSGSSGNHSCAEDGDSFTPASSPDHMLGKDLDQDKDSGIEFCGEDILQPLEGITVPDKDLMKSIIDMVEFYFSDANLLKDTFLLKHVRRNKEGYVSLKLITNFRKVKTLARDWRIVAYSLKHSQLMQVNDQCTKVRRKLPLPSFDETQCSRSIMVTSLSSGAPMDTGVLETVSRFGDIVLFRHVKSSDTASLSEQHKDLKKFLARRPDLEGASFSLVEFAKQESAARAVKEIKGYCAFSLADKATVPAQTKPQPQTPASKPNTVNNNNNNNNNKQQQLAGKKTRKGAKKQATRAPDSSDSEHQYSPELRRRSSGSISSGYFSSSPRYPDFFERRTSGRTVSLSAVRPSIVVRPRNRLDSAPVTNSELSAEASPWVQRRIASRSQSQSSVIVLREPRGPDGSAGFQPRILACA